jgi:uncharacterized protein
LNGAPNLRVIDAHAHVASTKFIPMGFIAGVARNMAAHPPDRRTRPVTAKQIQALLVAQNQDHLADQLVRDMDEAGVAQTVLLIPDFSHALECSLSIAEMAEQHRLICQRHPGRFYVFQGIDPRGGPAAAAFFERTLVEYGFHGLKLYPPCGYSPSDELLFPFYEICRRHRVPVLLHTGPTAPVLDFNYAHPSLIDRAAREFEDVNFILAHGGVNYTHDAALQCAYRPNVYLDIAGFPSALHPGGWKQQLRELFRIGISDRIIFGTDWPLFRLTSPTKWCVDELTSPTGPLDGLAPSVIQAIMAGNIERLLSR